MEKPLCIGMISQSLSRSGGGVSEAMRLYCEAIDSAGEGHELQVFAPLDSFSGQDAMLYGCASVHQSKAYGPQRFAFSPGLLSAMLKANLDVLLVHGLWQAHALTAYLWHKRTGRPLVITLHGMLDPWIMRRSAKAKQALSILFQNRLLETCAVVHALTRAEEQQVRAIHPRHRDVEVLPNYVSRRNPGIYGRPKWWRREFDSKRVFMFFGRIHRKKGVIELCQAWSRLCVDPAFAAANVLVFCGWVDNDPEIDKLLGSSMATHANFLYAGPQFRDDRWQSIAAADFIVLPSKSEGLPMGVLECWGMMKPTIMTDNCNLPEGFAAEAAIHCGESTEAIVEALYKAADLPADSVAQMGQNAGKLIDTTFSRENFSQRMIAMLRRACSTSK